MIILLCAFTLSKYDLTAKTPKMKKYGLNIKLLFADFLEKGTICSEIKYAKGIDDGIKI
jgi:hypothetical protein